MTSLFIFYFNYFNYFQFKANDVSSIEEAYQTPNRILITMDSNYLICDYVFPDENDSDICDRIKELFNLEITDPQTQIVFAEDLPRKFC